MYVGAPKQLNALPVEAVMIGRMDKLANWLAETLIAFVRASPWPPRS
jgi:hypothetical protein